MIIRVSRRTHPFILADRRVFEDEGLSWAAKGILGYMLSRPDDWRVHVNDLLRKSPDEEPAVRSCLQELEITGYLQLVREHNGKGASYTLHERPHCDEAVEESTIPDVAAPDDGYKPEWLGRIEGVESLTGKLAEMWEVVLSSGLSEDEIEETVSFVLEQREMEGEQAVGYILRQCIWKARTGERFVGVRGTVSFEDLSGIIDRDSFDILTNEERWNLLKLQNKKVENAGKDSQ